MRKKLKGQIRLIQDRDIPEVLAIYRPFILHTHTCYEYTVPSLVEFTLRIHTILSRTPWIVYEIDDVIGGYAYAGPHRSRAAYQWSVESSVYVHADHYGKGIGAALYQSLFALLKKQGFYNVYAGISLPNERSISFHQQMGFTLVGEYQDIGFKQESWHTMSWWQLHLRARSIPEGPPILLPEIDWKDLEWQKALNFGMKIF